MLKTKLLCVILAFFLIFSIFQSVSAEDKVTSRNLDNSVGSWAAWKTFVEMTSQDNMTSDGQSEYCFSSHDVTGWMSFGFTANQTLNIHGSLLSMSLKIEDINLTSPLSLTVIDSADSRQGYQNIPKSYLIGNNTWENIILDLDNPQWQDSDFNEKNVTKLLFSVNNGGDEYDQKVWVHAPILMTFVSGSGAVGQQAMGYPLILAILSFAAFCCVAGFVLFSSLKFPLKLNFGVALPIYAALGAVFLVILFSCLCFLNFSIITVWVCTIAICVLAVILVWKRVNIKRGLLNFRSLSFWLPVGLFIFSLIFFLRMALDIGWGAYVDSQTHGLYTSLILYNNGFPSSSFPVGDFAVSPLRYPMGFHALSAFSSTVTGLYPGQVVLAVATAIVCFIPSLVYSLMYAYTKSMKASLLAFLFVFFIPGNEIILWQTSQNVLFGGYLVGTYPNLLGNMIFIVALTLVVLSSTNRNISLSRWSKILMPLILLSSLTFGYYALLPFLLGFLILDTLVNKLTVQKKSIWDYVSVSAILLLVVGAIMAIVLLSAPLRDYLSLNSHMLYSVYMRYPVFDIASVYVVYGIMAIIGFLFSLWFLFRSNLRSVGLFYIVFFVPLMVAQNEFLYANVLWFIQPDRVLVLLALFSFVVTLLGVFELSKIVELRRKLPVIKIRNYRRCLKIVWIPMVIFFVLCLPSLMAFMNFSYPNVHSLPNENDQKAMAWLAANATSGVILNDRTVVSNWASSFRAMPVINDREILLRLCVLYTINGTELGNRTVEANYILDHPSDYGAVKTIAEKYNITYLYLTDNQGKIYERGQVVWPTPDLSPEKRIFLYMENPYLQLVYRSGNAVIFQINSG